MVLAKAAVICPALRDFPSDLTPLGVKTAGVAALRRGFSKRENAGRGRKMPPPDGYYMSAGKSTALSTRISSEGSKGFRLSFSLR